MQKRLLLGCAVFILFAASPLFAAEQMIADMDTSASSSTFYAGGTAGYDSWADGSFDPDTRLGPSGRSFHLQWAKVDVANEYAGGGIYFNTNATPKDISAYNNVSFMVYTPSAAIKAEIQLQDNAAHTGKVKLSDYVTTIANTWQEVVVPLAAFKRNNASLDLTQAVIIQLVSDFSNGLEYSPSGSIRVDNLQVSRQTHAPSNSLIYSGSDKGAVGVDDMPGDTLITWDQAGAPVTSNEVTVRVSPGYSIVWVSTPTAAHNLTPGATGYYAYQLRNAGNRADRIVFSTETLSGTWTSRVIWDKDKSGTYTAGDAEFYDTFGLLPESTHYFLLAIYCPLNAANGSSTKVRLVARDNFGAGTNDSWSSGGGTESDYLTADITDTCQTATIALVKSTSTATGLPGGSVTYTMTITNSGSAAASNLQLIDVIPTNMEISADATLGGSAGTGGAVTYYVGSSWTGTRSASATKVRWTWTSVGTTGNVTAGYTAKIK